MGNERRYIIFFDRAPESYRRIIDNYTPLGFEVCYWEDLSPKEKEEKIQIAHYFLVVSHKIDKNLLIQAKNLRYIQRTGVGTNNIDMETANKLGLPVAIIPGGNAVVVAELTILLILALYRKLIYLSNSIKDGHWLSWEFRPDSFELAGKTHGIVGFGKIGKETAKRSKAFGTNVIYYDSVRSPSSVEEMLDVKYVPFKELLRKSDVISIHIPLTEETEGMIGEEEFILMKESALIINVSRGGIINEDALYNALLEKRISGAGIDTWIEEPINIKNKLVHLDNVIGTPHIGAGTIDTFRRVIQLSMENINLAEKSKIPDYVVNNINKIK